VKAVLVRAPMDFGVVEVPTPACPPDGLLLRVLACGLCGSDLRTLRNGHHRVTLPFVIGHEISAVVEERGPRCEARWAVGDRLSVAPLVYCGGCDRCIEGRFELCDGYREIGQAWPGGLAEYVALPGEAVARGTLRALPDGLDPVLATVAEPLSSCIHGQETGAVGLGDHVAILGSGPIGSLHIMLARARGAARVIVADVSAERLAMAGRFGPDALVDASASDPVAEVRRLTGGRGADVVITANPVPASQVQAVEMARKGGRVLLFGGLPPEQSRPGLDTNRIHYHALHVMGTTIFAPRHHAQALDLLAGGRVDADSLVTHRLPLERFSEGAAAALEGRALKVVFEGSPA
jgi:L-iditol 2-dehydrogenase